MRANLIVHMVLVFLAIPGLAEAQSADSGHSLTAGISSGFSGPRGIAGTSVAVGARFVELEGGAGIRMPKLDCDPATSFSLRERVSPVGSFTLRGLMPFETHTWHLGAGLAMGSKTWCSPHGGWLPGYAPSEGTLYRIDRAYWAHYGFGLHKPVTRTMEVGGEFGFMVLLNRNEGRCTTNCALDAPDSAAGRGALYLNLQMRWGKLGPVRPLR